MRKIIVLSHTDKPIDEWSERREPLSQYALYALAGLRCLLEEMGLLPEPEALTRRLRRLGLKEEVIAGFLGATPQGATSKHPVGMGATLPVEALGDSPEEAARVLLALIRKGMEWRKESIRQCLQAVRFPQNQEELCKLSEEDLANLGLAVRLLLGELLPSVGFYDNTDELGNSLRGLEQVTEEDIVALIQQYPGDLWVTVVEV